MITTISNSRNIWTQTTLSDFCGQRGQSIEPSKTPDSMFELYSVPSFPTGQPEIVLGKAIGSNKQLVSPNSVLLCKINPRINRAWVVGDFSRHTKIASTEWIVFPPDERVEPRFLSYYLQQNAVRDFLASNVSGVGGSLMRVKPSTLRDFPFTYPERAEQRTIVAEIEKQFSRLDEAVASLKRTAANLKRYKATVLKAAVEGKLTEDWRLSARAASHRRAQASELEAIPKAGRDKWFVYIIECDDGSYYVGHTTDLHDRWQRHCEGSGADWTRIHPPKYLVHFEECGSREDAVKREQDLKTGFGKTWRKREIDAGRMKPLVHNPANETAQPVHGEDMQTGSKLLDRILIERRASWKGKGKYHEPMSPDTNNLPNLPRDWTWTTLGQLLREPLRNGHSAKASGNDQGLRAFTLSAVTEGDFSEKNTKLTVAHSDKVADLWAEPGDIYVERSNTPELVGIARLYKGPSKFAFIPDLLIRVRVIHFVSPAYVEVCLLSEDCRRYFRSRAQGISGSMPKIDQSVIEQTAIPLPPSLEQQQIIAEVERRLSVIDELEASVEADLTRVDRLRQSILGKAFSGRLLSNGACE